jgi:hypothetical protein
MEVLVELVDDERVQLPAGTHDDGVGLHVPANPEAGFVRVAHGVGLPDHGIRVVLP